MLGTTLLYSLPNKSKFLLLIFFLYDRGPACFVDKEVREQSSHNFVKVYGGGGGGGRGAN